MMEKLGPCSQSRSAWLIWVVDDSIFQVAARDPFEVSLVESIKLYQFLWGPIFLLFQGTLVDRVRPMAFIDPGAKWLFLEE